MSRRKANHPVFEGKGIVGKALKLHWKDYAPEALPLHRWGRVSEEYRPLVIGAKVFDTEWQKYWKRIGFYEEETGQKSFEEVTRQVILQEVLHGEYDGAELLDYEVINMKDAPHYEVMQSVRTNRMY